MRTPPSLPEDLGLDREAASRTIARRDGRWALHPVRGRGQRRCWPPTAFPWCRPRSRAIPTEVGALARALDRRARRLRDQDPLRRHLAQVRRRRRPAGAGAGRRGPTRGRGHAAAHCAPACPAATIKGFTVQPMIRRPDAHELILGMSVDPTFGPLMMFGAGGTAVEVLRDTAHALPPLDLNLARDLMRQTRVWQLLQGYRDRPPVDVERASPRSSSGSATSSPRHPEIREIDINPLIADDKEVIALDARVRVADARPARACRWRSGPTRRSGRRKRRSSRSGPSAFARSGPRTSRSTRSSSPT